MKERLDPVDIASKPDLARLVDEVSAVQKPLPLQRQGKVVALLVPAKPARRPRNRGKVVSADDTIWNIIGMGRSGGLGDVSENKHKYLADAYADTHE